MFVIDGLDAVEACYTFAGTIGVSPDGLTLRQLWRMVDGRNRQRRAELIEQSQLIWAMDQIDVEAYLEFGAFEASGKGGPVQVSPDVQARIDAEIERIQRENPGLPRPGGSR